MYYWNLYIRISTFIRNSRQIVVKIDCFSFIIIKFVLDNSFIHEVKINVFLLFCFFRDLETAMPNIVLQVKADVKATLREVSAPDLSSELETLLERQITDLVDTKHKIRYLVSEYKIKD